MHPRCKKALSQKDIQIGEKLNQKSAARKKNLDKQVYLKAIRALLIHILLYH